MATDATGSPTPLGIPTFDVNVDAPSGNGSNAQMSTIDTLLAARATIASPAFTGTPTAPTPTSSDNSTNIATTAFVKAQAYLTAGSAVASFNSRVGAVVPTSGDYTAAQVTHAADLSQTGLQTFLGPLQATSYQIGSGTGAVEITLPVNGTMELFSPGETNFIVSVGTTGQYGILTSSGNGLFVGSGGSDHVGFFGATPIVRPGNHGHGLDVNGAAGGAVFNNFTSSGQVGTTQYSFDDVVGALKNLGLITP